MAKTCSRVWTFVNVRCMVHVQESKTFHPVNMFRELLASPALFKTFVYFEKKEKSIFITSLFGTGYILLILFIAQVLIKQIKNNIYVSKHEA